MSDQPERFEVLLEVAGGEANPARCQLARLLKRLGRGYGVRCLSVRPGGGHAPTPGAPPAGPSGLK